MHSPDIIKKNHLKSLLLLAAAFLLAAALFVLPAGCGGGATITMKDLTFQPDTVTIKQGQTVTWKNDDRRDRQVMSGHPPVMTDDFMSPLLRTGESWSFKFDHPGEYPFHDMMIPGQVGTVIVQE